MASVTDQNHLAAGSAVSGNFHMHFSNQWAGRIEHF